MTTITCKVSEALNAQLESAARKRRVAKPVLVRKVLEERFRNGRTSSNATAYDLMKDGCGVVRGGPRDRSWNKNHLRR
jgi:hypothetical protein